MSLPAEIPWARRVWALPFLSALAHSERYAKECGKRHKPLAEWAGQLLLLVGRWCPEREVVAVADGGYASPKLLDRCRKLGEPIAFITRLRLDAALYEPAPPRGPGRIGRPRLKGKRLPNLSILAEDPNTEWTPLTIAGWCGGQQRIVGVLSQTAVWYSTGLPAVPLRWVLIRDPQEQFETQALLSAPTSPPRPSGSSRGSSGDGRRKRPSKKKYVSIWASRRSGIGRRGRSRGQPRRC